MYMCSKSYFLIKKKTLHEISYMKTQAETAQAEACKKFEAMSARGEEELTNFKTRRVAAFRKSLVELAELEVKHAKSQYEYLRQSLLSLQEIV